MALTKSHVSYEPKIYHDSGMTTGQQTDAEIKAAESALVVTERVDRQREGQQTWC